jgi:ABC-type glycerol-3-phosphate transport system substrate-binding protein
MNAQMIGADVAGRAALRNSGAGGAPGFPGQPQGFAQGGPPGFPGQAGGAPTGFGAPGAGSTKAPDYTEPIAAAESFLAALESKDTQLLAEAVAIRGQYEAKGDAKQQMFRALKEENLPQEDLDALVRAFDGMEVRSKNTPKSSGRVGVIVGKQDDNKLLTRTLYVRREKEGWKILDFSGPRSENTGLSTKSKRGEGY